VGSSLNEELGIFPQASTRNDRRRNELDLIGWVVRKQFARQLHEKSDWKAELPRYPQKPLRNLNFDFQKSTESVGFLNSGKEKTSEKLTYSLCAHALEASEFPTC
jgi:hypothetical protein